MKDFLIKTAHVIGKAAYKTIKLASRHPMTTYFVVALPACTLMCSGAYALKDLFGEEEESND